MSTISTRTLAGFFLIFGLPIGYYLIPLTVAFTNYFFCEYRCLGVPDPLSPISQGIVAENYEFLQNVTATPSFSPSSFFYLFQNLCIFSFMFGLWVIHRDIKEGEKGYALTLLGLLLMVFATVATIGWQLGEEPDGNFYMYTSVRLIFNSGLVLFSLGLSTSEQHNTKLAYVVILATLLFGFGQVFVYHFPYRLGNTAVLPELWMGMLQNLLFLVVAVWAITLGLKLRKAA